MITKIHYLPSYPFGESTFNFFRQTYTEYDWHLIDKTATLENALIVGDSNAFTKNPSVQIKNSVILAINPIWKKISPEPIWLSIPLLRKSFLHRMVRFRSSSLIDSYLHPHTEHVVRHSMTEALKNSDVWYRLLKNDITSNILQAKNNVFLLTNNTDPLRDVGEQNNLMQYENIWQWQNLSHSVLAMTDEERLGLKQILLTVAQDKGL